MPDTPKKARTNWKKLAKDAEARLEELHEEYSELQSAYEELKLEKEELVRKGLGRRDAVKLNRYQYLVSRLINLQVDAACRKRMDQVIDEELKYLKEKVWENK